MLRKLSRRRVLERALIGGAGTGFMTKVAVGQETSPKSQVPGEQPRGSCVLLPKAVEGPYYFDPEQVRSDITEGRPGFPVRLVLRVIEHATCQPIAGARVDVWHADARGIYSGYPRQGDTRDVSTKGETYLRGTQIGDKDGQVVFQTIYPGWYPGRTPHIHVKVFLDQKTLVTSQIYFPDEVSARIYKDQTAYEARPVADTTNRTDFIFQAGQKEGGGIVVATEQSEGSMTASLIMAVDRSGKSQAGFSIWKLLGG